MNDEKESKYKTEKIVIYKSDVRRARKHGNSVVITMTGFLEAGKEYFISRDDGTITIRETEYPGHPKLVYV